MLCSRRGGCFADGCYKWGCSTDNCSPTGGCCGGGGPLNVFQLMTDPCHKKLVRNSMQLVYGAYCGGWCPPRCGACPPPPLPCPILPSLPNAHEQEPVRIVFKCPTYCTPYPDPVIVC